jgi:hypothetical protein
MMHAGAGAALILGGLLFAFLCSSMGKEKDEEKPKKKKDENWWDYWR